MTDVIKELEEIEEVISIVIVREQASIDYYIKAYNKAVSENARRLFAEAHRTRKGA